MANKFAANLKIDSTFSQFRRSGHSDWIGDITLPGNITKNAPRHSLGYLDSLIKMRTRDLLAWLFRSKEKQIKFLRQYHSSVTGYDMELEQTKPPATIVGYFQTWRYFQGLKDEGLVSEINMKRPSRWLRNMTEQMRIQGNVLGIHVRRGDYVGNAGIGTLSVSYYEAAAEELRSRGAKWDYIWIFSDEVERVEIEFAGFLDGKENLVFVKPPSETHAFESLLLLSKSSYLVIANSTFSWWAATLGNPDKITACPSKWFAQIEDPVDLCPQSWVRVPSAWANL